ncbi:SAF domain-containing protein [Actinomadura macrotermitis]|uniref:SAF domain-containing protein n=1 Tax=Actinomadura macrotermitis TaxID=2585200 RepID=A0A7K0BSJ6_9ACTN|nr:hypothetical protein [Actinomadura macrotermitis]
MSGTVGGTVGVALGRRRRGLAALFAAAAAGFGLLALRPPPPPAVPVVAAARDLPAGARVRAADLRTVALPPAAVPDGLLRAPAGRVLTGPMRRGEPFTSARVLGDGLLRGHGPGTVAAPVRIADADSVRLLRPGDRVDVLAAPAGGRARLLVSGVPVLAIPRSPPGGERGALVVLATGRDEAAALAGAGAVLSVTVGGH